MLAGMIHLDASGRIAAAARTCIVSLGLGLVLTATVHAEEPSRYRTYRLGAALTDVLTATGARAADVVTLHERPSRLERLTWRPPYTRRETLDADPVESLTFAFVDGQLYEITVDYDRSRIASLTPVDLVAGVEAVYGTPRPGRLTGAAARDLGPEGTTLLARWGDDESVVLLLRGPYEDLHLKVRSTRLRTLATRAIAAAQAQDLTDAPAREAADAATAAAATASERTKNRSAFKP